jgi:hypothetical protein
MYRFELIKDAAAHAAYVDPIIINYIEAIPGFHFPLLMYYYVYELINGRFGAQYVVLTKNDVKCIAYPRANISHKIMSKFSIVSYDILEPFKETLTYRDSREISRIPPEEFPLLVTNINLWGNCRGINDASIVFATKGDARALVYCNKNDKRIRRNLHTILS